MEQAVPRMQEPGGLSKDLDFGFMNFAICPIDTNSYIFTPQKMVLAVNAKIKEFRSNRIH